ncbi:MAG: hypothetical protein AAFX06_33755, partial [Planctomycetota bacterium]
TRFVRLDVDIDSDNDNQLTNPDRSIDEEDVEDIEPGKTVLTNIFDTDGDHLPGWLDGYQNVYTLLAGMTTDDRDTQLTPVIIDIDGLVCSTATIRFVYNLHPFPCDDNGECDPRRSDSSSTMRLWATNSSVRNPASILDGGDFVPPGVDIPLDILDLDGVQTSDPIATGAPSSDTTLFIEAITTSDSSGQARLSAQLRPGPRAQLPFDQVRMTNVEVELFSRGINGIWTEAGQIAHTTAIDTDADGKPDNDDALYQEYLVVINDPRDSSEFCQLSVNGFPLLVQQVGSSWVSQSFVAGAQPIPFEPNTASIPASDSYLFNYNPSWLYLDPPKLDPKNEFDLAIIIEILEFTEEDTNLQEWRGRVNPATGRVIDTGEFGKYVHDGVALRLESEPRWIANVYFDIDTKEIISIGERPSNLFRTVEVDAIAITDPGYTPQVGSPIDADKIRVYEIKNSSRGDVIHPDQVDRIVRVTGKEPIGVGSPYRMNIHGELIVNSRTARKLELLGNAANGAKKWKKITLTAGGGALALFGPLASAQALIDPEERQIDFREINRLRRKLEGYGWTGHTQYKVTAQQLIWEITRVFRKYTGGNGDLALNLMDMYGWAVAIDSDWEDWRD